MDCLGRISGDGLVGGGVPREVGFEISKALAISERALSLSIWHLWVKLGCKLLATASGPCLLACHHSTNHDAHGL